MRVLGVSQVKSLKLDIVLPALLIAFSLTAMYFLENIISVYRPIISFELMFSAALTSLRSVVSSLTNFAFTTIFFLVLSFQLVELVSVGFNISILDIYFSIVHSAAGMPIVARYVLILFVILWIAVSYFERKIPRINIRKRFFLMLFVAPISFDIILGANRLFPKDIVKFPNIISAPIINRLYSDSVDEKFEYWDNTPKSNLLLFDSIITNNYVLFIEFESLGVAKDGRDDEFLNSIIQKTFKNYELINKFEEKFFGGTLSGELRTLCGIKSYGDLIRNPEVREGELSRCIPNILANSKNSAHLTIAAHANFGSFYNREKVYPALGFDKAILASDLNKNLESNCDNVQFVRCDNEVLDKLKEVLTNEKSEKIFIHFMTINSHFPYSGNVVKNLDSNDSLTAYFAAVDSTLDALAHFINGSKIIPDVIIISGDHAPPFTSPTDKSKFESDVVPVYVFKALNK